MKVDESKLENLVSISKHGESEKNLKLGFQTSYVYIYIYVLGIEAMKTFFVGSTEMAECWVRPLCFGRRGLQLLVLGQ